MATLAVSERKSPWIMSPSIDLIIGCGAWSLPLLILPYFLSGTGHTTRALGFYTLACFRAAILANPDNLDGQNALARVLLEAGPL